MPSITLASFSKTHQFVGIGIHRNYKFVQLFQVVVVRYAESDWKEQFGYISKINLGINLILCMWLGIYIDLYDSDHSYKFHFLHLYRHPFKQQIDLVISSRLSNSLVLEFWSQHSLSESDCVIVLHEITPEWFDLLTPFFFADSTASWLKPTE